MDTDWSAKLREPFAKEQIGKLPKLSCKKCSESPARVCGEHKKAKCQVCGNFISTAHIDLDYVGHAVTTARLLDVDPTWSWRPFTVDELAGVNAERGELWIWLTVAGVTRAGVGDGGTAKIRIGDAIRNAAMRFGVALDLWAKEDLSVADDASAPADTGGTDVPSSSAPTPKSPAAAPPAVGAVEQGQAPAPTPEFNVPELDETGNLKKDFPSKPSKEEMSALTAIAGELVIDSKITVNQLTQAAGGPWPTVLKSLSRDEVVNLTERLERYANNVKAPA